MGKKRVDLGFEKESALDTGHRTPDTGHRTPVMPAPAKEEPMDYPEGLKYSKEHEWVLVEGDSVIIGISDFAQNELGEVVYVEVPEVGEKISKEDPFGAVESVKAVSDLYAPVSGTVVEVNDALPDTPELINDDPYGEGWIIKVTLSDPDELDELLSAKEYTEHCEGQDDEGDEDDG
jgi:glycine cleavage system H protein